MFYELRARLTASLVRFARAIGNPVVEMLLHSPVHRLLSGGVLLITYRGVRSGRHYTTPAQYVRRGPDVYLVSRRGRTWWRNVRFGAQVGLQLRGRHVPAFAEPLEVPAEADLRAIFRGSSLLRAALRPDAVVIRARLHEGAPGGDGSPFDVTAQRQRGEQQGRASEGEYE